MIYDSNLLEELYRRHRGQLFKLTREDSLDVLKHAVLFEVSVGEALNECGFKAHASVKNFSEVMEHAETDNLEELLPAFSLAAEGYESREELETHVGEVQKFAGKTANLNLRSRSVKNTLQQLYKVKQLSRKVKK